MGAILTNSGRIALAEEVYNAPMVHLAWGSGDVSWGASPPSVDPGITALLAEVARRKVTEKAYVVPDAGGSIILPSGNWTISGTPTRYLYLRFHFDFGDAVGESIREQAVFIGTTLAGGVDPATNYLLPAQVATPGRLFLADRTAPIVRQNTVREQFEYVVTF